MNVKQYAALAAAACNITLCRASVTVAEWKTETVAETANRSVVSGQTFRPTDGGLLDTISVYGHGSVVPDILPAPSEVTVTLYDVVAPFEITELASKTVDTSGMTEVPIEIAASFADQSIVLEKDHGYAFGVTYPTSKNELLFLAVSDIGYAGGELSQIFGTSIFPQGTGWSLSFKVTASAGVPDSGNTGIFTGVAVAGLLVTQAMRGRKS